jgi:hypothetical protein
MHAKTWKPGPETPLPHSGPTLPAEAALWCVAEAHAVVRQSRTRSTRNGLISSAV